MNKQALQERAQNLRDRHPQHRSDFERFVIDGITFIIDTQEELMGEVIPGLEADVDTLAAVVPQLVTNQTKLQAELAEEADRLKAAEEAAAAGSAEREKLAGELQQVEAIKAKLDPIVAEAQGLVPTSPQTGQ